ncbi:TAFH domain-containing protein [Trichostrongylus colubriformis]|uniref:TAFH domain-containing protein n=1 Tax=Trichostrongylus colubriformis TaxID=6319 RepID=A0AAN8G158_TRICO
MRAKTDMTSSAGSASAIETGSFNLTVMSDPPASGGGPKFRIVAGRGLGERPSPGTSVGSPLTQEIKPPTMMASSTMHMQHQQHPQPMQQQQMAMQGAPPASVSSGVVMQMNQPQTSQSNTPQPLPTSDSQGMVTKCVRFFKTLIQLSQQPEQQQPSQNPQQTAHLVKELVSTLVFGQMPAEEFTTRLQSALKSQAQPHLLPFLHKTLPYLRAAMRSGEVTIEGVVPPPGMIVPPAQQIEAASPQQQVHMQMQHQQHIITAQPQPSSQSAPQHIHSQPMQVQVVQQHPQQQQQQHYQMHEAPAQMEHQQMQMHPHPQMGMQQSQQIVHSHSQHQQMPMVSQQMPMGHQQHAQQIPSEQRQTTSQGMMYAPTSAAVHVVSVPIQEHNEQFQVASMERTDSAVAVEPMDDAPAQHPEEEMIQVRQLQEGALESALLRPPDIMSRITQCMNEMCYVDEEVLVLISDAAECRLREIIGELAILAEHRMEPLRLNPNYGPIDDTRRQLRFLEDIDRQQEEQRENREKEALIRMSKSKGIAKDTIERAKEMQRADAEAKRNRDANAAAIAALSSGSKVARPKWDQVSGGGVSGAVHRPRTVRVNIRDLHVLVNKDSRFRRSQIAHKLALSGPPSESL